MIGILSAYLFIYDFFNGFLNGSQNHPNGPILHPTLFDHRAPGHDQRRRGGISTDVWGAQLVNVITAGKREICLVSPVQRSQSVKIYNLDLVVGP